jgi:hypothetical protein
MKTLERRSFLSLVSYAAVGTALSSSLPIVKSAKTTSRRANTTCWLEVCAPFIIQDSGLGIESEVLLTSDNFFGAHGYADGEDATEYQICLYDFEGHTLSDDGIVRQLTAPAMQTTLVRVSDLIGSKTSFWGGMKIRLRPKTRTPTHASDLFSSAFVRWKSRDSFTNVHANPDPLQWQRRDSFFYSMPFPPLDDYQCAYSIFNPYDENSSGAVTLYDQFGTTLRQLPYNLKPHSSVLVDLRQGEFARDPKETCGQGSANALMRRGGKGGTVAITNRGGSVKNFGYMLIKQASSPRFSVEHPIHQPPYNPTAGRIPFDSAGRFKAQTILYTPLVFNAKKLGGVTLSSRFHLSSGAPVEETLWLSPFITDDRGNVVWQAGNETKFPGSVPEKQIERGAIRLMGQQSCVFDCSRIDLPKGFSGGFSLAITPVSNHTLMKVEVIAAEWNATAFTHFRPGLAAARAYQKPAMRSGLGTDYIVSGARLRTNEGRITRDEIIAVINIDDKAIPGDPTLEIFDSSGLATRVRLGPVPAFSCRHYLLSALPSGKIAPNDLSLRLVDERATLLMSVLHLDYDRRDSAADHGSDRFSTFTEFTCDPAV